MQAPKFKKYIDFGTLSRNFLTFKKSKSITFHHFSIQHFKFVFLTNALRALFSISQSFVIHLSLFGIYEPWSGNGENMLQSHQFCTYLAFSVFSKFQLIPRTVKINLIVFITPIWTEFNFAKYDRSRRK